MSGSESQGEGWGKVAPNRRRFSSGGGVVRKKGLMFLGSALFHFEILVRNAGKSRFVTF